MPLLGSPTHQPTEAIESMDPQPINCCCAQAAKACTAKQLSDSRQSVARRPCGKAVAVPYIRGVETNHFVHTILSFLLIRRVAESGVGAQNALIVYTKSMLYLTFYNIFRISYIYTYIYFLYFFNIGRLTTG